MAWFNLENNIDQDLTLSVCTNTDEPFADLNDKLNRVKDKIDEVPSLWHRKKKLANPYEMISSNYHKGKITVMYDPFSRSYYKMWEILKDYDLLPVNNDPIKAACLAEGPGGFMEAIINQRQNMEDKVTGITLPPTNEKIPGWVKMRKELSKKNRFIRGCLKVEYGDLYKLPDIIKFAKGFKDKADIVTADGGFDFSTDYNSQESMAQHLIFAEIVTALTIQKCGGSFICKVFDLFTNISIKLLYLIAVHYSEVYLVKPKVSRPANSEKYIVARGFRGIDQQLLKNLYLLLVKWNPDATDINGIDCSDQFMEMLVKYNNDAVEEQITSIENTMMLIRNKISKEQFNDILNEQRSNAIKWCQDYDIPFSYQD